MPCGFAAVRGLACSAYAAVAGLIARNRGGSLILSAWRISRCAGGGLGALEDVSGGAFELAEVDALELAADRWPGLVGLGLGEAGEEEGEEAEQDVRADAVVFSVVDGSEVEGVFECAPAAFDLDQLLVAERDVVGRERVVGAGEEELAVDAFFGSDLVLVDDETAAAAGEVAAQRRVGEEERLGVAAVVGGALALERR